VAAKGAEQKKKKEREADDLPGFQLPRQGYCLLLFKDEEILRMSSRSPKFGTKRCQLRGPMSRAEDDTGPKFSLILVNRQKLYTLKVPKDNETSCNVYKIDFYNPLLNPLPVQQILFS